MSPDRKPISLTRFLIEEERAGHLNAGNGKGGNGKGGSR